MANSNFLICTLLLALVWRKISGFNSATCSSFFTRLLLNKESCLLRVEIELMRALRLSQIYLSNLDNSYQHYKHKTVLINGCKRGRTAPQVPLLCFWSSSFVAPGTDRYLLQAYKNMVAATDDATLLQNTSLFIFLVSLQFSSPVTHLRVPCFFPAIKQVVCFLPLSCTCNCHSRRLSLASSCGAAHTNRLIFCLLCHMMLLTALCGCCCWRCATPGVWCCF